MRGKRSGRKKSLAKQTAKQFVYKDLVNHYILEILYITVAIGGVSNEQCVLTVKWLTT